MRSYPRNSPQAAARLVAVAMICDGNVCRSELDAVRREGAENELGLASGDLGNVLQTLCEDLMHTAQSHSLTSCIDDDLLESLIREVDDPALQRKVIAAIAAATTADGHLSEGERRVLDALQRCWGARQHSPRVHSLGSEAVTSARLEHDRESAGT